MKRGVFRNGVVVVNGKPFPEGTPVRIVVAPDLIAVGPKGARTRYRGPTPTQRRAMEADRRARMRKAPPKLRAFESASGMWEHHFAPGFDGLKIAKLLRHDMLRDW